MFFVITNVCNLYLWPLMELWLCKWYRWITLSNPHWYTMGIFDTGSKWNRKEQKCDSVVIKVMKTALASDFYLSVFMSFFKSSQREWVKPWQAGWHCFFFFLFQKIHSTLLFLPVEHTENMNFERNALPLHIIVESIHPKICRSRIIFVEFWPVSKNYILWCLILKTFSLIT